MKHVKINDGITLCSADILGTAMFICFIIINNKMSSLALTS